MAAYEWQCVARRQNCKVAVLQAMRLINSILNNDHFYDEISVNHLINFPLFKLVNYSYSCHYFQEVSGSNLGLVTNYPSQCFHTFLRSFQANDRYPVP
jgi:hypothetical protein